MFECYEGVAIETKSENRPQTEKKPRSILCLKWDTSILTPSVLSALVVTGMVTQGAQGGPGGHTHIIKKCERWQFLTEDIILAMQFQFFRSHLSI